MYVLLSICSLNFFIIFLLCFVYSYLYCYTAIYPNNTTISITLKRSSVLYEQSCWRVDAMLARMLVVSIVLYQYR